MNIPTNLLELLPLKEHRPPLKKRLIYFLYSQKEIVYIGKTENIQNRTQSHLGEGAKVFNHIKYFEINLGKSLDKYIPPHVAEVRELPSIIDKYWANVERGFIKHYQPKFNKDQFKPKPLTLLETNAILDQIYPSTASPIESLTPNETKYERPRNKENIFQDLLWLISKHDGQGDQLLRRIKDKFHLERMKYPYYPTTK